MTEELKNCPFCGGEAEKVAYRANLTDIIIESGTTSAELAETLGISRQSVCEIEKMRTKRGAAVEMIAQHFRVSVREVVRPSDYFVEVRCKECGTAKNSAEEWNRRAERTCRMDGDDPCRWRCTNCGAFVARNAVADCVGVLPATYCPNCGAKAEPRCEPERSGQ